MELVLSTELTAFLGEVSSALAAHTTVQSDADIEAAAVTIKKAKQVIKKIGDVRRAYTSQLDDERKRLVTQERALTFPIEEHLARLKSLTNEYLEGRRKIAEAARAKAAEEARVALEQSAAREALGITVTTPAPEEPSFTLTPPEIQSLEKLSGVSSRVTVTYKVIDESLVPRHLMSPDDKRIKDWIASERKSGKTASEISIQGIEVYEKTTTVIR